MVRYCKKCAKRFMNKMLIPIFEENYYNRLVNYYVEKYSKNKTRRRKDGTKYDN